MVQSTTAGIVREVDRPGGLSHRSTICYDSGFGTSWLRTASNMLRGACRSVILRKYPLLRNDGLDYS